MFKDVILISTFPAMMFMHTALLVQLDVVCRKQTRLTVVFARPPILIREFLKVISQSQSRLPEYLPRS